MPQMRHKKTYEMMLDEDFLQWWNTGLTDIGRFLRRLDVAVKL